jgi:transcriptional regulator with XRE-family HTH domain
VTLPATDFRGDTALWGVRKPSRWESFGKPRCLLESVETGAGEILLHPSGGTITASHWVPISVYALGLGAIKTRASRNYDADVVIRTDEGLVICQFKFSVPPTFPVADAEEETPLPESALVAKEVRNLSGLSAERLGEIFPVERESYQRWISGRTVPSPANLERLLALRHFLRELPNRVPEPKSWLLSPLGEGTASPTPHQLLKAGNLAELWNALADLPSSAPRYTRQSADGSTLTVTEGSLRGRDLPTSAEELDNYDDWLSEDE